MDVFGDGRAPLDEDEDSVGLFDAIVHVYPSLQSLCPLPNLRVNIASITCPTGFHKQLRGHKTSPDISFTMLEEKDTRANVELHTCKISCRCFGVVVSNNKRSVRGDNDPHRDYCCNHPRPVTRVFRRSWLRTTRHKNKVYNAASVAW